MRFCILDNLTDIEKQVFLYLTQKKKMEEKILEIIRTGRNFTQMAEDIAVHLKEFISWVGSDYSPCVLLYNDDGEKDYWIVYKDGTAEILVKFKTTDELYEYWLNNIRTVSSTCDDTKMI